MHQMISSCSWQKLNVRWLRLMDTGFSQSAQSHCAQISWQRPVSVEVWVNENVLEETRREGVSYILLAVLVLHTSMQWILYHAYQPSRCLKPDLRVDESKVFHQCCESLCYSQVMLVIHPCQSMNAECHYWLKGGWPAVMWLSWAITVGCCQRFSFLLKSWLSWSAMHIVRLPGEYVRIYIGIIAA